jgi:Xaa-Pro aminopeptidase
MYQAVRAAQKAALSQIRPGVKGATVHNAAQREIERRGFRRCTMEGKACGFIHGTGHGVGLCVHEAPSLSTVPGRLRSGHVVTVEPGLYFPDVGGVRIEDTVLVTKTGWRYLVPCEKRLEL